MSLSLDNRTRHRGVGLVSFSFFSFWVPDVRLIAFMYTSDQWLKIAHILLLLSVCPFFALVCLRLCVHAFVCFRLSVYPIIVYPIIVHSLNQFLPRIFNDFNSLELETFIQTRSRLSNTNERRQNEAKPGWRRNLLNTSRLESAIQLPPPHLPSLLPFTQSIQVGNRHAPNRVTLQQLIKSLAI